MGFRSARIKSGLSAYEVAKILGVSATAVYLWESGECFPRRKRLVQVAALYKCTVDDLLKGN